MTIWNASVSPGPILTGIFGKGAGLDPAQADQDAGRLEPVFRVRLELYQPIRRAGVPTDVAAAALWLASDAASFVTGQDVVIDGGILAGPRPPRRPTSPPSPRSCSPPQHSLRRSGCPCWRRGGRGCLSAEHPPGGHRAGLVVNRAARSGQSVAAASWATAVCRRMIRR